jgi:phosphotransferase system HPr-like phosphotransfer protein
MREFNILINSFQKVQAFVSLAMVQPFEVMVGNDHQLINGKSFMGLFSLNCQEPLQVTVRCSEEEFLRFRQDASRFLV